MSGRLKIVTSTSIWNEYHEQGSKESVLRLFARRGVDQSELRDFLLGLLTLCEDIVPVGTPPACRDPKDRKYLHCAVTAKVAWLVSRDRDLLDLGSVNDTSILTPEAFLKAAEATGLSLES